MDNRLVMVALLVGGVAGAAEIDPTAAFNDERDALIDKIARGVDSEASVRRFAALVKMRDQQVATSHAAVEAERAKRDAERSAREQRQKWQSDYRQSIDAQVANRCTLSADPAHPVPSTEGRYAADWGKVTARHALKLAPKNELDEGAPVTLYEIAGARRAYLVHGEQSGLGREQPFVAEVGDLVLVCDGGTSRVRGLPPPWDAAMVQRGGLAVKLAAPPLIAGKRRWNPIHITASRLFWAIREVTWKYPPEAFVLVNVTVGEALGGGRFSMPVDQGLDWIAEVKPSLPRAALLVPGHQVWAILGGAHFDHALKKLVLTVEDLEDRYVR